MNGWIMVKDQLPDEFERVIVYAERNTYGRDGEHRKRGVEIGYQYCGRWRVDGCIGVEGIAWMPLPKPPEGTL